MQNVIALIFVLLFSIKASANNEICKTNLSAAYLLVENTFNDTEALAKQLIPEKEAIVYFRYLRILARGILTHQQDLTYSDAQFGSKLYLKSFIEPLKNELHQTSFIEFKNEGAQFISEMKQRLATLNPTSSLQWLLLKHIQPDEYRRSVEAYRYGITTIRELENQAHTNLTYELYYRLSYFHSLVHSDNLVNLERNYQSFLNNNQFFYPKNLSDLFKFWLPTSKKLGFMEFIQAASFLLYYLGNTTDFSHYDGSRSRLSPVNLRDHDVVHGNDQFDRNSSSTKSGDRFYYQIYQSENLPFPDQNYWIEFNTKMKRQIQFYKNVIYTYNNLLATNQVSLAKAYLVLCFFMKHEYYSNLLNNQNYDFVRLNQFLPPLIGRFDSKYDLNMDAGFSFSETSNTIKFIALFEQASAKLIETIQSVTPAQ